MSDDVPAPLPAVGDPWVLLDTPRGSDLRTIKRAYARRIKVYRPDRWPDEFARVHAAFELLKQVCEQVGGDQPVAADEPAEVVAPSPPPPRPSPRPSLSAVVEACERGDAAAADQAWRTAGMTLAAGFAAAADSLATRRWLAGRAPVTWRQLASWDDPALTRQAWLLALRVRLDDERRHDEARAMLDEPALLADVAHDELAAELALRGVSALAWIQGGSRDIFRKLGNMPLLPQLESLRDEAQLDLDVGESARGLPPARRIALPPALHRYLVTAALADHPERAELMRAMYDELAGDLTGYVATIDRLTSRNSFMVETLARRFVGMVPGQRNFLNHAASGLRESVAERMTRLSPRLPWSWTAPALIALLVAFAIVGLVWSTDPLALGIFPAIAVVGLVHVYDHRLYRKRVRPALLAPMVELGVTRLLIFEWLTRHSRRAFRAALFRSFLERDHGSRLVSFIATASHPGLADDEAEEAADDDGDDGDGSLLEPDEAGENPGLVRRVFDWFNQLPFTR